MVLGFAQVRIGASRGIWVGLRAFGYLGVQIEACTREHSIPTDVWQIEALDTVILDTHRAFFRAM